MKKMLSIATGVLAACCGLVTSASGQGTCATAVNLTVNAAPVQGTLLGVTAQAAPTFTGTSVSVSNTVRGAFYRFTTGDAGVYEITGCANPTTTANAFDSVVLVWTSATPCTGAQTVVAANDDSCGSRSSVAQTLLGSTEYYVRYAEFSSATTTKDFAIAVIGPSATTAPANDDCATPAPVSFSGPVMTIAGTTSGATGSSTTQATCGSSTTTGNDVWYAVTVPANPVGVSSITYTVRVCGNFDTILSSHSTCAAAATVCADDSTQVECSSGFSQLTFTQTSTVNPLTQLVRVAGVRSNATTPVSLPQFGDYLLTILGPEANNFCASGGIALSLNVPVSGNNTSNLSTGAGAASTCNTSNSGQSWFTFTPAADGAYLVSTCGSPSGRDSVLTVFNPGTTCDTTAGGAGVGNTANILACNDNSGPDCAGSAASVQVNMLAGMTYVIRYAATSASLGAYQIVVKPGVTLGACCAPNGTCSLSTPTGCPNTTTTLYVGDNTTCLPSNPCVQPGRCCFPNSSCTNVAAWACAAPGVVGAAGTTCNTTTSDTTNCGPAAPTNPTCATASVLTVGTPFAGNNFNQTPTTIEGAVTCQTSQQKDVWFVVSPASSAVYSISTCGSNAGNATSGHDTVVSVFAAGVTCAGISTASNIIGCNDDGGSECTGTNASLRLLLVGGQSYLIRMSTWGGASAPAGGSYTMLVNTTADSYFPCCNNTTGVCTNTIGATPTCAAGSTAGALNTVCGPSSCPPINTCCNNTTGVCSVIYGGLCPAGTYTGVGTVCDASACPPIGVCCDTATGACSLIWTGSCTGSTAPGTGNTCVPGACPASGACCTGTTCSQLLESNSASCAGTFTLNAVCVPNLCLPNDTCAGAIAVSGALPQTVVAPASDATNDLDSTCNSSSATATNRGVWYSYTTGVDAGVLSLSEGTSNDVITQLFTGTCAGLTASSCSDTESNATHNLNANTTYYILMGLWDATAAPLSATYSLTFNSFTAATGACCTGTTCSAPVAASACSGLWLGAGTTCAVSPQNSESPAIAIPDASEPSGGPNVAGVVTRTLTATAPGTVSTLAVRVGILHTWGGDVRITIAAPGGSPSAELFSRPTGTAALPTCPAPFAAANGNDLNGVYTFSDAATTGVNFAFLTGPSPLASGSYKAQNCDGTLVSLDTVFAGVTIAGTWTLTVSDEDSAITGTLNSWGLIFNGGVLPCDAVGACCTGTSCSSVLNAAACSGGTYQGAGSTCSPTNPCAPSTQNCCRGTTCNSVAAGTCTGTVAGSNSLVVTTCGAGDTTATCCYADFNHDGIQSIDDLFLYFNAYFTSSPYANFGGDAVATPTIDDLFLYINAYFGTCL